MATEKSKRTVAIVGGGLGGMSAAIKSQELGLQATIFEKSPEDRYLCASRYAGGFFHIAMDNIAAPPDEVMANIDRMMRGDFNRDVAQTLANNGKRTIDWLKRLGVRFIKVGHIGGLRNALSPPGVRQTGIKRSDGQPYWVGRSGDAMLRQLEKMLTGLGGSLRRGHRVVDLIMDGGRCVGVVIETAEGRIEYEADAVVIADGGFQSNKELLGRYITSSPDDVFQRNARTGGGDGLQMAARAGAEIVVSDRFYGHLLHAKARNDDGLWPYPTADVIAAAAIVVDEYGDRFCDEGAGGIHIANEIAQLDNPAGALLIFDKAIWDGPARSLQLAPNPYMPSAGGEIVQAPTLSELAAKVGIDPAALERTVKAYNDSLAGQGELNPPRSREPNKPWPIEKAPFMAIPLLAGVTYSMGGIRIDPKCRVVSTGGDSIPGLYVAGVAAGGVEGGGMSGYMGGLCQASIFGMLAGEHIAGEYLAGRN